MHTIPGRSVISCVAPDNHAAATSQASRNIAHHAGVTPLSFRWELPPPDGNFYKFSHDVLLDAAFNLSIFAYVSWYTPSDTFFTSVSGSKINSGLARALLPFAL